MKNMKKFAVIALLASCAGGVEDIDRTQPNILEKDFFAGEWYASWTAVDVPFTTGFASARVATARARVRREGAATVERKPRRPGTREARADMSRDRTARGVIARSRRAALGWVRRGRGTSGARRCARRARG